MIAPRFIPGHKLQKIIPKQHFFFLPSGACLQQFTSRQQLKTLLITSSKLQEYLKFAFEMLALFVVPGHLHFNMSFRFMIELLLHQHHFID